MKIEVLFIEKNRENFIKEAVEFYAKRISNYAELKCIYLQVPSQIRKKSPDEQKRDESLFLKKEFSDGSMRILLDEKGKSLHSVAFSRELEKWINTSPKKIQFFTGGPYGVYEPLKNEFHYLLSVSPMTFSHQLVRPVFLEQLYRAFTIIRGEKYHHI